MKLQVNPHVEAHGSDLISITGTRAEGEAIECMDGALVLVLRGGGRLVLCDKDSGNQNGDEERCGGKQVSLHRGGSRDGSGWKVKTGAVGKVAGTAASVQWSVAN
jgi:hypothetical protein